MHVAIIGAGGMGALFGAILQEGGLTVTLYDTDADHVSAIARDGLKIEGFGGDRSVPMKAVSRIEDIGSADVLLFQCKGAATRAAATAAKPLVDAGAVAISFQNGLGNEEVMAEILGPDAVLGGVTQMAGLKLGPGRVHDFSRVPCWIGAMGGGVSEQVSQIARSFTDAGLETHASAAIVTDIWRKLLGNIAMSAVSGATNLTSAEALTVPELRALSLSALDEALAVGAAEGVDLDRAKAVAGMEAISAKGGSGDNKSSLCVDLLNGRRSEVDFIYGTVIERAARHGVPVPVLKTLHAIVKGLESKQTGGVNDGA